MWTAYLGEGERMPAFLQCCIALLKKTGAGSDSLSAKKTAGKKSLGNLIITLHCVNFYDSRAGLAGIKLVLPAGIARPAPAECALAEL
jgi:hypothetical protein